jgi:hypothetical protein
MCARSAASRRRWAECCRGTIGSIATYVQGAAARTLASYNELYMVSFPRARIDFIGLDF